MHFLHSQNRKQNFVSYFTDFWKNIVCIFMGKSGDHTSAIAASQEQVYAQLK
jgi:hypothetical protein